MQNLLYSKIRAAEESLYFKLYQALANDPVPGKWQGDPIHASSKSYILYIRYTKKNTNKISVLHVDIIIRPRGDNISPCYLPLIRR